MIEREYINRVKKKIYPLLKECDNNLSEIASLAEGVLPVDIINIVGSKYFQNSNIQYFNNQTISFPEPNPIDYEWRFAEESANLVTELIDLNNKKIGCFGVPTVFFKLLKKSNNATLFDINPFLSNYGNSNSKNIITFNLNCDKLEGYDFDVIIMDPPWYISSYSIWIKQAINNLKLGGIIYITKIPSLTRPLADKEWTSFLKEFEGVMEEKSLDLKVFYDTPFFEIESYDSCGFGHVGRWRNAEIAMFQLKNKKKFRIHYEQKDSWKRFRFGNKVVSLKIHIDDFREIKIKSPYEDGTFTLKSVSERYPKRENVNFLTSRNKALIIEGTMHVYEFLIELEKTNNLKLAINKHYSDDEVGSLELIYALIGI